MMLPGILQSTQQNREASTAVGKTNTQLRRQFIERSAEDHRNDSELRLRGHADGPGHHVLRHAVCAKHVPGMHEHRCALIGAMVQKGDDAGIVEILLADMIANLHAEVSRAYAPAQLLAGCINVLQRNLAERFETTLALRA